MTQQRLDGLSPVRVASAGVGKDKFYVLVHQLNEGTIVLPPHQRDFVWDQRTQQDYVAAVVQQLGPFGQINTYSLEDDPRGVVYLNDGSQRLRTVRRLLEEPGVFDVDYSPTEISKVLMRVEIGTEHTLHKSHQEAVEKFQKLNRGLQLTPYEYHRGELAYGQVPAKMDIIEGALQAMYIEAWGRVVKSQCPFPMREGTGRASPHQLLRVGYADLVLMITGYSPYSDAARKQANVYSKGRPVEKHLADALSDLPSSHVQQVMGRIRRHSTAAMAAIERGLAVRAAKMSGPNDVARHVVSGAVYRTVLAGRIKAERSDAPMAAYDRFIVDLISSNLRGPNFYLLIDEFGNESDSKGASYAKPLPDLQMMAESMNHEILKVMHFSDRGKKIRKKRDRLASGWHNSHVEPVALTLEDGDVVSELASLNLERGARPMETS